MTGPRTLGEDEQRSFFADVLGRARMAESKLGLLVHDLEVGGTVLRFAFAGPAIRDALLPAMAHLEIASSAEPHLTIHVWESQDSGVVLPPAPCPTECFTDRGELWIMPSERIRSAYHWLECSLSLLDLDGCDGVYWVRAIDRIPYWVRAAPFRGLLNWWMQANGGQLLHAAAVGIGDEAVLITGKGGTGKSTTALTSLQQGLRYVGDDYVIVCDGDPPVVWSLYRTAKIDEGSMQQFSVLNPQLGRSGTEEKAVITLDPTNGASLARSLRLRAVLTPEFGTEAGTQIEPVSRQKVRDAALFTTLLQLPHVGQRTLEFIDNMLDRLPTFLLRLGSRREAVPAALATLLRSENLEQASPSVGGRAELPLVSVVIPVHNGARFLAEAIDSVLAQEYPALDIIIVDDGSLDDIGGAVAALPVDVRFLKQLNAGPAAARNRGVINASADYVAFLDVDDLWTQGALRSGIEAMLADRSLDVVKGRGRLLVQEGGAGAWHDGGDSAESFPYWIGSAVYRREAFRTVGLFDEQLRFGEDSDWFLRAKDRGAKVELVERTTLLVRRHDANMTLGKSGTELVPLRLFKNVLDRRRGH